ncbi:MAG: AEC family transporter, partial [Alphaproteobacteria bacterium]|nr:AEC family transporter [Alphaproteobacteria bacterium]
MLDIIWTIAPIFLLIVLGNLLRRNGIPSVEFWNLNDKIVYWVLFPALLFHTTSTLQLSSGMFGS